MKDFERAQRLVQAAPPLRKTEEDGLNRVFRAYLFKRNATGEFWTSCCGRHIWPHKVTEEKELEILRTPHTPQPVYYAWSTRCRNEREAGRRAVCPYCGAEVTVKELGRCGGRKNLWEYRRAVVLRQYRGALWALAYEMEKSYRGSDTALTARPKRNLLAVYRFRPGCAESAWKLYWEAGLPRNYKKQTAPGKRKPSALPSPFGYCSEYGMAYDLVGEAEVGKSEFRYIGFGSLKKVCDPIRLLATACFYPRQVEMLGKLGLSEAVHDYVERGVKNAAVIKWDAEKPKEFLAVDGKTARRLRQLYDPLEAMKLYKRLLGSRAESGIDACDALSKATCGLGKEKRDKLIKIMKSCGVKPERLLRYEEKERLERQSATTFYTELVDYWDAAQGVGLDLGNEIFLLPKGFRGKHDSVCAAWAQVQNEKMREKEREAYAEREKKRQKKYAFSYGGYQIVVPRRAQDIVDEGKNLHHCVGGYAQRHMSGATTILFLRREQTPGESLATIEIYGNKIRQIHGWDDERTPCPENPDRKPCEALYKEFLSAWLKWLEDGSKRNRDGSPVLPKRKEKKAS